MSTLAAPRSASLRRDIPAPAENAGWTKGLFTPTWALGGLLLTTILLIATILILHAAPEASAQVPAPARGYELISHYPTQGLPVIADAADVAVSEAGDRVLFTSFTPLPGAETFPTDHRRSLKGRYLSTRGADQWIYEPTNLANGRPQSGTVLESSGLSADGTRYLFTTKTGFDPDDQDGNAAATVGGDLYQRLPDGSLVWISRDPRIPPGTPQTDPVQAAVPTPALSEAVMSADGRTVVFWANGSLADGDTTPAFEDRLYKWSDGEPSFIGARPDGSVPQFGSRIAPIKSTQVVANTPRGAVSRDGARVVFRAQRTDGNPGESFYVQTDGQPTVEATKETGVPPLPVAEPFNIEFRGASSDTSRVFFTSSSRLTPDSGAQRTSAGDADLYVYDIDADKVRDLTPRLDGVNDPNVDPAPADRAGVQGVAAVSENGKRVYFVANAAYPNADPSPTGATPVAGGRNLYMAEIDEIDDPVDLRLVATLASADTGVWDIRWNQNKTSYAAPDGSVLGFGSKQELTGQPLGGTQQLFVFNADENSLECASCPSDGSAPGEDVNPNPQNGIASPEIWQHSRSDKRWVSSEGSVFFDTATPLLPADHNQVDDVYEYDANGDLHLISAGTGTEDSKLEGASRDGSTVIFNTFDALDPRDDEPGVPKLYAARVGGGFPASAPEPSCEGEECRGESASPPASISVGSVSFLGDGNVPSGPSVAVSRLRAVVGSAARLRVRVPGAGRISVAGSSVRRTSRSASRAGTYSVRVALSSKAKRALRKRRKLRVNVRVSYRARDGQSVSRTVKVTFKRPKAKRSTTRKGGR